MPRQFLYQIRRDTATNWTSTNPILASGEPAYETDIGILKIGNGTTAYNTLVGITTSWGVVNLDGGSP